MPDIWFLLFSNAVLDRGIDTGTKKKIIQLDKILPMVRKTTETF